MLTRIIRSHTLTVLGIRHDSLHQTSRIRGDRGPKGVSWAESQPPVGAVLTDHVA